MLQSKIFCTESTCLSLCYFHHEWWFQVLKKTEFNSQIPSVNHFLCVYVLVTCVLCNMAQKICSRGVAMQAYFSRIKQWNLKEEQFLFQHELSVRPNFFRCILEGNHFAHVYKENYKRGEEKLEPKEARCGPVINLSCIIIPVRYWNILGHYT